MVPSFAFGEIVTTDTFYTCGSNGNSDHDLHLRDKTTGVSISSNVWNVTGLSQTVDACNGLAQDPTDLQWYAMIQDSGFRYLTKININDGTGSDPLVVSVDESGIASLAISNNGTFYATIGGGEDIIGTIDKSTGTFTPQCVMGNTLSGINRVSYDYTNDRLMVLQDKDSGFASISIITDLSPATCVFAELDITGSNTGHSLSMAFHTVDNIFYTWLQSNITGEEVYHAINPVTEVGTFINDMDGTLDTFTYSVGSAFALSVTSPDSTPPVISTLVPEPIILRENQVFDELEFVQCIDDTDGDITNTMAPEIQIDTSNYGLQSQDYFCQDSATNSSVLTVQYLIKRANSSSGSGSGTSDLGGVTSIPSTTSTSESTTPTLSLTGEEGFSFSSFFDRIEQLFQSRLSSTGEAIQDDVQQRVDEQIDSATDTVRQEVSEQVEQRTNSFVNFFSNFFRNIFGG